MPGVKVNGGTRGSSITLCHGQVGQGEEWRCPPTGPILPRLQGGTRRLHRGGGGSAGARREELGQEDVLVQWTNPRCIPGAGELEKACGAQKEDGLCREPHGTEQQLHSLSSQPHHLLWTSRSSPPPPCPPLSEAPAAPMAESPQRAALAPAAQDSGGSPPHPCPAEQWGRCGLPTHSRTTCNSSPSPWSTGPR